MQGKALESIRIFDAMGLGSFEMLGTHQMLLLFHLLFEMMRIHEILGTTSCGTIDVQIR